MIEISSQGEIASPNNVEEVAMRPEIGESPGDRGWEEEVEVKSDDKD
jgi:hypothetical protein